MKKKGLFLVLTVSVLISACSGYFSQSGDSESLQADLLAIENRGGYLSGPSNDITPFLYRDTNGQNPVLFFSSDRDGSYDIYYARMNPDGTFQNPVKMTNISSDGTNQYCPRIYIAEDYYTTQRYLKISFINQISTNSEVITYTLSSSMQTSSPGSPHDPFSELTSIDLEGTNTVPDMIFSFADGRTNLDNLYYEDQWGTWTAVGTLYIPAPGIYSLYAVSGVGVNWTSQFYLLESDFEGRRQFFLNYAYVRSMPVAYERRLYRIPEFASSYNDRWPYVDLGGYGQVYFCSDRGINGDYDLFRYNEQNFPAVIPPNPFD